MIDERISLVALLLRLDPTEIDQILSNRVEWNYSNISLILETKALDVEVKVR